MPGLHLSLSAGSVPVGTHSLPMPGGADRGVHVCAAPLLKDCIITINKLLQYNVIRVCSSSSSCHVAPQHRLPNMS